MIDRLQQVARLITFVAAFWILAVVVWGLATGGNPVETPLVAVWLLIFGIAARVALWFADKVARRS